LSKQQFLSFPDEIIRKTTDEDLKEVVRSIKNFYVVNDNVDVNIQEDDIKQLLSKISEFGKLSNIIVQARIEIAREYYLPGKQWKLTISSIYSLVVWNGNPSQTGWLGLLAMITKYYDISKETLIEGFEIDRFKKDLDRIEIFYQNFQLPHLTDLFLSHMEKLNDLKDDDKKAKNGRNRIQFFRDDLELEDISSEDMDKAKDFFSEFFDQTGSVKKDFDLIVYKAKLLEFIEKLPKSGSVEKKPPLPDLKALNEDEKIISQKTKPISDPNPDSHPPPASAHQQSKMSEENEIEEFSLFPKPDWQSEMFHLAIHFHHTEELGEEVGWTLEGLEVFLERETKQGDLKLNIYGSNLEIMCVKFIRQICHANQIFLHDFEKTDCILFQESSPFMIGNPVE